MRLLSTATVALAAAMSQAYMTCIRYAFVRTTKLRILHGEQMGRLGRLPETRDTAQI